MSVEMKNTEVDFIETIFLSSEGCLTKLFVVSTFVP